MIVTKVEKDDSKYRKGITQELRIKDRFGRVHTLSYFVGTIFHKNFPYDKSEAPYDVIEWMDEFEIHLHSKDDDFTQESGSLPALFSVLYNLNDTCIGEIYQKRTLSDGTKDSCVLTYTSRLVKA